MFPECKNSNGFFDIAKRRPALTYDRPRFKDTYVKALSEGAWVYDNDGKPLRDIFFTFAIKDKPNSGSRDTQFLIPVSGQNKPIPGEILVYGKLRENM